MGAGMRALGLVALTTGLAGLGVGIPRVGSQEPIPSPSPSPGPTPGATATPEPTAVPSPDPRPDSPGTPKDRVDGASRDFATEVVRLSAQADAVDRLWEAYRVRCEPGPARGYEFGREWFGLWDRAFVPRPGDPGCAALLQQVAVQGGVVLMGLTTADSLARHAGVTPVSIHGMVRWNGLEWWPLTAAATQRASR